MFRTTIDFGIDLGTTNSTIAVIDGVDAKVIPNSNGSTVTPSAVYINPKGTTMVGWEAKEATLKTDWDNGDFEFKLRMGLGEEGKKVFARSGREMHPEELSAEVLKQLRTDVRSSMDEEVRGAVITVPAAFALPQIKATSKAAELAGFELAPILLEPVAASLAYGFQSESENAYWFVYDFGGGTFDAALMRVRDGLIQVVHQHGDNNLGGKLLDWDLVTKLLVPALKDQYKLPDFGRGSARWQGAMGRLKWGVEKAKIEVCRTRQSVDVYIPCLCNDDDGNPVEVFYSLTPGEVEAISRPYIERSLGLCGRTLAEKGLTGSALDRVIMVGGSTLNPWVREAVESELGATLEFGIDPVTVVARGAAIFASAQPMPRDPMVALPMGTWHIEININPVGNESDPDIGGRVIPEEGAEVADCTIELRDTKTRWSTGRIPLDDTGTFMTQLYAERKRRCEFAIELLDATGRRIPTQPDRVFYTIGIDPAKPPCPHSIGIGLEDGTVAKFIAKGQPLPAQGMQDLRTTVGLRAGHAEDVLRIPVLEGEHAKASRNQLIGQLVIMGTDVHRDLPVGSPIEITVKIDESVQVQVLAFVQLLEKEFEKSFDIDFAMKMEREPLEVLCKELDLQKARLAQLRSDPRSDLPAVRDILDRITREAIIAEAESLADAAKHDADALSQLDRRLRDLAALLDQAEGELAWPKAIEDAEVAEFDLQSTFDALTSIINEGDRALLKRLLADLQEAIDSHDETQVRRCIAALDSLRFHIYQRDPGYWFGLLNYAEEHLDEMTDPGQARVLIQEARQAADRGDFDGLRSKVAQLWQLFKVKPSGGIEGLRDSGVGR